MLRIVRLNLEDGSDQLHIGECYHDPEKVLEILEKQEPGVYSIREVIEVGGDIDGIDTYEEEEIGLILKLGSELYKILPDCQIGQE